MNDCERKPGRGIRLGLWFILQRSANRSARDNGAVTEKELIQQWVETWKAAGPELEKIRLREVRDEDTGLSLRSLASAFNHATSSQPARETSGLVEMQRFFRKLPR